MPDDELMALMSGGGDTAGPVTSPMATPQASEGEQQAAMVDIAMAMDLLERSLAPFGSDTPEGQSILKALSGMAKVFSAKRDSARELIPAEIQALVASLPQTNAPTPEAKGLMQGMNPAAAAMQPPAQPMQQPQGAV